MAWMESSASVHTHVTEKHVKGLQQSELGGEDNNNFIFVKYNKNKIILFVQRALHGLFNFHTVVTFIKRITKFFPYLTQKPC